MLLSLLTTGMHQACPGSKVIWYDSVTVAGELRWQNALNQLNQYVLRDIFNCLMGQGYIMLYCSVAGPSADTCKKDCICGSPIWKSKVIPSRISITSLPLKCRITELLLRAGLICAS